MNNNNNIRLQSSTLNNSSRFDIIFTIYQMIYSKVFMPYIWKLLKFFIRLITNTSEIERICSYNHYTKALRTFYLLNSLQYSTKLISVYKALNDDSLTFNIQNIKDIIIKEKKIRNEKSQFNLESSLSLYYDYNRMLSIIHKYRLCPYDRNNPEHEMYLEELWNHLKPDQPRCSRITDEWEDIGFQGNDPATDFRGMGILGLLNLLYFAKTYPTQSKWVLKSFPYPFSITGINITGLLVSFVSSRKICGHFFEYGSSLETFNELYCRVFYAFAKMSIESGETSIMSFPPVFSRFTDSLQRIINENNGIFNLPPSSPFKQNELLDHNE